MAKQRINKELTSLSSETVSQFNRYGLKIVSIRQDRACCNCGIRIMKGADALTFTSRQGGKNTRYWACNLCGKAMVDEMEYSDKIVDIEEDYGWDDGLSSTGH